MNLTSMLVLTTMFINVSNNLPKTSYMKMIDVWLLFNLLYPFLVVLLHTYMDTLRNQEETEMNNADIDTNKVRIKSNIWLSSFYSIKVGLAPVNEAEKIRAQIEFSRGVNQRKLIKRKKRLELMKKVSLVYIPCMCLSFAILYWLIGLKQAEII